MKTFSIIIPSYNSKNFVKATIMSIVMANYDKTAIEVIIVDDGSTDGSFEYINTLIAPYPYIRQVQKPNGNWGSVINYVKHNRLATREIVAVLDADDQYLPQTFQLVNQKIANHDLFSGAFYRFNGQRRGRKVYPYWFLFKRVLTNKQQMNSPYCLPLPYFFKRELFEQLEDLREQVPFQDSDFFSQLIRRANSMIFTKAATGLYYFQRPNNSRSIAWDYDQRFEPELYACYRLMANDACETVAYRLNVKPFYNLVRSHNIQFTLARRLKFKWFPWFVRWIYWLLFNLKLKKIFIRLK